MIQRILCVKKLCTKFHTINGTIHAVNAISFNVNEGETLGIVGESGCGKSVSMLSILRLLPQPPAKITAESILFKGKELLNINEGELHRIRGRQIGMVFQDPMTSLNPVRSIGYQLIEPLKLHMGMNKNEAKNRAIELLRLVGIPEPNNRILDYPYQFSGGMRQRAMIAMALSCNPSLLIADEPTTALDVTIQAQIVELVKRLRDQLGMALIWITHDLGIVAGLADKVNVMYAGFIVESGFIDDIYDKPLHPYTIALLHSLPAINECQHGKLETIDGLPPELYELPKGCPFVDRCKYVDEKCKITNPHLKEVETNHFVSCWIDVDSGKLR
jgi:oligopeptide transport system ATP-binding protein